MDGRKLSHKALERIRITAVHRVRNGEPADKVMEEVRLTKPRIYEWLALYEKGGFEALKAKKIHGRPSKLTDEQLAKLYRDIVEKNPLVDLGFSHPLWRCSYVQELIQKSFGIVISESQAGRRILQKIGLRPTKLIKPTLSKETNALTYGHLGLDHHFVHWGAAPDHIISHPIEKAQEFLNPPGFLGRTVRNYGQDCNLRSICIDDFHKIARKDNAIIYFVDDSRIDSAPTSKEFYVHGNANMAGYKATTRWISATTTSGHWKLLAKQTPSHGGHSGEKENASFHEEFFKEFVRKLAFEEKRPIYLIMKDNPRYRAASMIRYIEQDIGNMKVLIESRFR